MNKTQELNLDIKNIRRSILTLSQIEDETDKLILRHQLHKAYNHLGEEAKQQVKQEFAQMQKELIAEAKKILG